MSDYLNEKKGSSLFQVGEDETEEKKWNSRIACLAVATHPLHQEKKRREVGFVSPRTAEWWEARLSLRGSAARKRVERERARQSA
jgi:hypothetical protein